MFSQFHVTDNRRFLIFATDYHSYHLSVIRAGIQNYFENSGANSKLSYLHLNIDELARLHGKSVADCTTVIGALRNRESIQYFRENGIPLLNLNEENADSLLGFDVRIEGEGLAAAKYFIEEMQLESLGFVGSDATIPHQRRLREFQRLADVRQVPVHKCEFKKVMHPTPFYRRSWEDYAPRAEQTRRFLTEIRKPAGIFCGDDRLAFGIYHSAEMLGINVPNEVAIIGIGSRSNAKEEWTRAISVVEIDHHRMGYIAAKLMDEFITQNSCPKSVRLISKSIHHRQTSVRRFVGDSLVRQAMVLIQQRPELDTMQLAEELKTTRKVLDTRFLRATNMTVTKAIDVERFTRAKRLIREKSYKLESIAALAGYHNSRSMCRSFYRFTKMNPREFRNLGPKDGNNA